MSEPAAGTTVPPVADATAELELILTTNLVPFWYPGCISPDGGYRQVHGPQGWGDDGFRHLIYQARQAWFFSRLARSPYGADEHLEAARHGIDFLWDRHRDPVHGGFYWQIDALGLPVGHHVGRPSYDDSRCKSILGLAYTLYALTEFANATGGDEEAARATEVFRLLETHGRVERNGSFEEFLDARWGPVPRGVHSFHDRNDPRRRTFGTQVHVLEALIPYVRLTGDATARTALEGLLDFIEERMVLRPLLVGSTVVTRDGRQLLGDELTLHRYGHDLELAWMLLDARAALGRPATTVPNDLRGLVANALAAGEDEVSGGIHLYGPIGQRPSELEKQWWVQAEALLCMLTVCQLSGERADAAAFHRSVRWIVDHQIDREGGGWHRWIGPDGVPGGSKVGPWKSAYHTARALLECLDRLEEQ